MQNTISFGLNKFASNTGAFVSRFLFTILFWFVKRYNKTNNVVNVWPRSEKDIREHGVTNELRPGMSRDGRAHIRWNVWSIYIGKPQPKSK